jgi:hypothetical protein
MMQKNNPDLRKIESYTDNNIIFARITRREQMDTKLTLKLDKAVIEQAKAYAAKKNKSLSRLIETYLRTLVNKNQELMKNDFEITPFVKSMRTGKSLPADLDARSDYRNYLSEKHK